MPETIIPSDCMWLYMAVAHVAAQHNPTWLIDTELSAPERDQLNAFNEAKRLYVERNPILGLDRLDQSTHPLEPFPQPSPLAIIAQNKINQWDSITIEAWHGLRRDLVDEKLFGYAIVEGEPDVKMSSTMWCWEANDLYHRDAFEKFWIKETVLVRALPSGRVQGRAYFRRSDVRAYLGHAIGVETKSESDQVIEFAAKTHEEQRKLKKDETVEDKKVRLKDHIQYMEERSELWKSGKIDRMGYDHWIEYLNTKRGISKREAEFVWNNANLAPGFRSVPGR